MDSINNNKRFTWTDELETLFLREIHFLKPYQYAAGSNESAETWLLVTQNMQSNYDGKFAGIDRKKMQDKLRNILKNREVVVAALARESGIEVTETELTKLKDDIIAERNDAQHAPTT